MKAASKHAYQEKMWQNAMTLATETVLIWLVALHREYGFSGKRIEKLAEKVAYVQAEANEAASDGLAKRWKENAVKEIAIKDPALIDIFLGKIKSQQEERSPSGAKKKSELSFAEAEKLRAQLKDMKTFLQSEYNVSPRREQHEKSNNICENKCSR